ncbi:DNA polymerase IV [Desulfolutivibrio sulfoxidireducens]|uniref:DNA polymerase IV n=1 Tax=Desulfolutivibrio sulfoxidireducens TaxID=2773299 RepID=UPI00159D76D3|nr:DNA polymerase IV [Desulfolutivibrio sulfoxidireducens]QLA15144.1 DNA polymerase IV [Desulfolutivibrio sulfoxidireducens]
MTTRHIAHVDMDAYFASVEQLDDPSLRGRPVIIGVSDRGVVSAASYEARAFGVRSAMPVVQARRLCPEGVFLPGRYARYKELSRAIMACLAEFSPLVEPASIDEAYVDMTGARTLFGDPHRFGTRMREAVFEATGLSCSVGVAPVRFLAKIASDYHKPGGLTVVTREDMAAFLAVLPVGKIPGVGRRTLEALDLLGIRTAGDMLAHSPEFLARRLGASGLDLYDKARGIDPSPVVTGREAKSVSAENTLDKDSASREVLAVWLLRQAERVGRELRRKGLGGRTVTLKLKYSDFRQITRSKTLPEPTDCDETIFGVARELLSAVPLDRPARLVGVGVSGFHAVPRRLSLWHDPAVAGEARRTRGLDRAIDAIRDRFGREAILRGRLFPGKPGPRGGGADG